MKPFLETQLIENINKLAELRASINEDTVGHLNKFQTPAAIIFDEIDRCKELIHVLINQLQGEC